MTRVSPPAAGFHAELYRLAEEMSPEADGASDRLFVAACRLPASIDPLDLWGAASMDEFAVFWEQDAETLAGIGETREVPAAQVGPPVDAAARRAATARDPATPRRFGCIPFIPGWTDDEWRPLTEAGFVLPRWTLHRRAPGESVELTLAVRGPLGPAGVEALAAEFETIRTAIENPDPGSEDTGQAGRREEGAAEGVAAGGSRSEWDDAMEAALREIRSGRLEKVVLARRIAEPIPPGTSARDILRSLRREGSGPYRFGLRRAGRTFVGASPECLFAKRGNTVEVEALAGTFDIEADSGGAGARGLVRAAEHLFASGKDLEEHALVVRGVVEALEPLAESVTPDDWPRVREARRLAHLSTTVRARVRAGVTAADLVEALHPTPAVGGLPREAAVAFIRRAESAPRGLFAAPVGWIGPDGDACFAVGIRSALLVGSRAWVYAGAGIVAASEPDAEWEETEAKLRWFRELVGTSPGGAA